MRTTLCTLYEGDYHHGVAALINSLVAAGFPGKVLVGHRGELPAWASTADVTTPVEVTFLPVAARQHLTLYKASFIRDVFDEYAPDSDTVIYCDPDIVMKAPWESVEAWFAAPGLALVEDINSRVGPGHPMRHQWIKFLASHGIEPRVVRDVYYNAGLVGVSRSARGFLDTWVDLCDAALDHLGVNTGMKTPSPTDLFASTDQDALNMSLMIDDVTCNGADPKAMDFGGIGPYFSHAVGPDKPWRGRYLRRAFAGYPPSSATKAYLHFADHPIRSFNPRRLASLRREQRIASFLSRLYKRV